MPFRTRPIQMEVLEDRMLLNASPEIVADINPGASNSGATGLTDVGGTLFFTANDNFNSYELWKSDGTENGTEIVKDINPGVGDSFPTFLTNVNGTLFFRAENGIHGR